VRETYTGRFRYTHYGGFVRVYRIDLHGEGVGGTDFHNRAIIYRLSPDDFFYRGDIILRHRFP